MKRITHFIMFFMVSASGISAEETQWWKGNLHTHSLWSDGDDYPEMIADWYKKNGYHFLGISDHNILAEGNRWIHIEKNAGGRRAFEKYLERFGPKWVEHKTEKNIPKVRLKNFSEYKAKMSVEGKFLLMQAEELTDRFQGVPIHINATNLKNYIPPQGGSSLATVIQNNVNAVLEQRKKTGQPMFPHINHPNFGWALKPTDMIQLKGEQFFEVYNGHPAVNNYGDAKHLSTVQIWDIINAYRVGIYKLPLMFGLATDDAHNYHQIAIGKSNTGRGWVMVKAPALSAPFIIEAMEKGDFYSSSGVSLSSIQTTKESFSFKISTEKGVTYKTWFVGTRNNFKNSKDVAKRNSLDPSAAGIGEILGQTDSIEPKYNFKGDELYVRAHVVSSKKKSNPYSSGEQEQAWLQPISSRK
ncbi:MAG: histidinol-phosphatase [Limisphaerales bacterium]